MNLTARLKGNNIQIFDTSSGSVIRNHALPPGEYSNLTVAGESVTVTILRPYANDIIRTISMKTGAIVSEFNL